MDIIRGKFVGKKGGEMSEAEAQGIQQAEGIAYSAEGGTVAAVQQETPQEQQV